MQPRTLTCCFLKIWSVDSCVGWSKESRFLAFSSCVDEAGMTIHDQLFRCGPVHNHPMCKYLFLKIFFTSGPWLLASLINYTTATNPTKISTFLLTHSFCQITSKQVKVDVLQICTDGTVPTLLSANADQHEPQSQRTPINTVTVMHSTGSKPQ